MSGRIYYVEHGAYNTEGGSDIVYYSTLKSIKAHLHKLGFICRKGLYENDTTRQWARIEWMDSAEDDHVI